MNIGMQALAGRGVARIQMRKPIRKNVTPIGHARVQGGSV